LILYVGIDIKTQHTTQKQTSPPWRASATYSGADFMVRPYPVQGQREEGMVEGEGEAI